MNLSGKGISKAFAVALSICFLATGCGASNTDISELEKRVDELEKQVAELKENEVNTSSPTSQERDTDAKDESTSEESTAEVSEEGPQVQYAYKLGDMSNDEIVEECMHIINSRPEAGSTLADYISSLHATPFGDPVLPTYGSMDSPFTLVFTSDENGYEVYSAGCDVIKRIKLGGMQSAMDGTIDYSDMSPISVSVEMEIIDYDRAVAIYNALYEKLAPYYTDIHEFNDGTSWHVQGSIKTSENSSLGLSFVSMNKNNTSYTVTATLVTRNN